ncbi:MAG: metalloregulator ArsR/SmtB family transcription factor [Sphaerochaetaceae bacterium]|nr:metalloregulator ArsR/SmtB family transcription factor [Sphaerochaetaceae bacterium]MDC7249212.1 metalloregulator ArsR/SmtB family transcription factor [Sphaerochaetaceae bacterium]
MDAITILKILSDQTRLRILNLLKEDSLCVGEIQTLLDIKQPNASKHLEKLKLYELILSKKKAQWVYYQINLEKFEKYKFLKDLLFSDIKREEIFNIDISRLKKYKNSDLCCQDLKNVGFKFDNIKFNT